MTGAGTAHVRSAERGEAAALAGLIARGAAPGAEPAPPGTPEVLEAALADVLAGLGDVLVAECDGELVGMCQLIVFRHLQHGGGLCAEIESMHVHPDHRGRGIGARLLDAAVGRAAELGCYRVQLTSDRSRVDAHRFYARHGFEPTHLGFKRWMR